MLLDIIYLINQYLKPFQDVQSFLKYYVYIKHLYGKFHNLKELSCDTE